ncbi:hypothetical protein [Gimesia sp.]|uniref:hypothetical protein n=1 Tax=Gimesia sp. TaxID=2024833 RepID=UPI003A955939
MLKYKGCVVRILLVSTLTLGNPVIDCVMAGGGLPWFSKKPKPQTSMEHVAVKLDHMEHKIGKDGTVVIKAPDIWGESRLTKHRQEFERVMAAKVDQFNIIMNASLRRSDQAYLANALAIQAAATSRTGITKPDATSINIVQSLMEDETIAPAAAPTQNSDGTTTPPSPAQESSAAPIRRSAGIYNFTDLNSVNSNFKNTKLGLEPTIELDQLKRYLDHLNEIRRVNEGDDTADSPGYSLNLVRIPVSVLPGYHTRKGHGAEVTVTATPHISGEILPRVFRELVINDLVDELSLSVLKLQDAMGQAQPGAAENGNAGTATPTSGVTAQAMAMPKASAKEAIQRVDKYIEKGGSPSRVVLVAPGSRRARNPIPATQVVNVFGERQLVAISYQYYLRKPIDHDTHLSDVRSFLRAELEAAYDYLKSNPQLWNTLESQVGSPEGMASQEIRMALCEKINKAVRTEDYATLQDLRQQLWVTHRTLEKQEDPGKYLRSDLFDAQKFDGTLEKKNYSDKNGQINLLPTTISSLAWAVLVEAALLNEQLNEDIKRVSRDPNCNCMCTGRHCFFGTDFHMTEAEYPGIDDSELRSDPAAEQAFVEYVKCRWPIHVFALDPQRQDQNIADTYSMRREMQLALALAFSSGSINAQNLTRYARRIEIDMQTVALNSTAVAFGHGADTFGWRFYPRVQSPPIENNLKVAVKDLLIGGPSNDELKKKWELEPGMRECVAIVLMPSFIEHVTFDSHGQYFKLSGMSRPWDGHKTRSTMLENTRWSEDIRSMELSLEQVVCEADRYREGEVERIMRRVHQVASKLPMQTVYARVPNENTLGGFEMFSSGITDLAPELIDYYGQPGINPAKETRVFLVGNHFSVHETQVLTGNRNAAFSLLSRDVMEVQIPAGVQTMEKTAEFPNGYVDVHVATPYGVSGHLAIPVIPGSQSTASQSYLWDRQNVVLEYGYKKTENSGTYSYTIEDIGIKVGEPHELTISVPGNDLVAHADDNKEIVASVVYSGQGLSTILGPTAKSNPFDSLKMRHDAKRRAYVIELRDYYTFHQNIKDMVQGYLNDNFPKGDPPSDIPLRVVGMLKIGGVDISIENELHLMIKLVDKHQE